VIQFFRSFEQEHQNSLARLEKSLTDMNHYLPLLQAMNLRISAKSLRISSKNLFAGTIVEVTCDAPVAQIVLQLNSGQKIYAVISHDSVAELQLQLGGTAYALVKASSVMISNAPQQPTISARNIIQGKISRLTTNSVLGEITLDIGGGDKITSTITCNSVERLGLKEGDDAWAVIKSSSVIIGVDYSHSSPV
jgi:molybdate transport system regulatory protein